MKENDNNKSARNSNVQQQENVKRDVQKIETTPTASNPSNSVRLDDSTREEVTQEELKAVALITRAWSGILPPPEDFNAYSKDAQNKIIEWNDAQILDESQRQNTLVHQTCKDSTRSSWFSFITNVLPVIASAVLFIMAENSAVFLLLTVPVITVGGNFLQIIIENHNSDKSDKKEK